MPLRDAPKDKPLCTIVHISDLHFGSKWVIEDESLWRTILPKLPALRLLTGFYPHSYQAATQLSIAVRRIFLARRNDGVPAVLVHSGDLTARGAEGEFSVGNTFLLGGHGVPGSRAVAGLELAGEFRDVSFLDIPGNHDLWSRWDNRMQSAASAHYGGVYPRRLDVELSGGWRLILHGMDSNRSRLTSDALANGEIPARDLTEACKRLEACCGDRVIQGIVLHHPLAIKPGTEPKLFGREIQKLKSRDTVARQLRSAGAQFVLCGHIHSQQVLVRGPRRPLQFTAGSGCQMGGPHHFWTLDIHPGSVVAAVHEIPSGCIAYERAAGTRHAF
ncbi:MAG: metallophosphoesterase [Bryobacteraceae bacterium]